MNKNVWRKLTALFLAVVLTFSNIPSTAVWATISEQTKDEQLENTENESETINDTLGDNSDEIEGETPNVKIVVFYHAEIQKDDFQYLITYEDQQGTINNYVGTYSLFDKDGNSFFTEEGNEVIEEDAGKITIPSDLQINSEITANEQYKLNTKDETINGYTIVLRDVVEGAQYTVKQETAGGLELVTEDETNLSEQTVFAQKNSDNQDEELNVLSNTCTFQYQEITDIPEDDEKDEETSNIAVEPMAIDEAEQLTSTSEKSTIPSNETLVTVQYTGTQKDSFEYAIKNGDNAYTGGYKIYDKDGKLIVSKDSLSGNIKLQNNLQAPNNATENENYALGEGQSGYTIVLTSSVTSVIQQKNGGMALESNTTQTIPTEKQVTYSYREAADDFVVSKIWNDGRESHDDSFKEHFNANHLQLQYKTQSSENWSTDFSAIGIAEVSTSTVEYEESNWTYTYQYLPKNDKNGNQLKYQLIEINCKTENCPISNYLNTSDPEKPNEIINTKKVNLDSSNSDYSATIVWKDKDQVTGNDSHPSRPTEADYLTSDKEQYDPEKNNLKLYRYTSGGKTEEVPFPIDDPIYNHIEVHENTSENGAHTNTWNITIKDLPKYDNEGNEYIYYIEQTTDFASDMTNSDKYSYDKEYLNTGAYGTQINGLYNGGILTNTRKEKVDFLFDVEWIDGNSSWLEDCDLYLYRYAEGDDGSLETASPVQGFDSMYFENGKLYYTNSSGTNVEVQKDADGNYTWTGVDGTTGLDKFAPSGARYTYFVKQKNLGSADYKETFYDANDQTKPTENSAEYTYILNGGNVVNQLKNTTSPSITKKWEAKAVQGITDKLFVVLELEKRYVYQTLLENGNIDTKYTSWETVTSKPEGEESEKAVTATVGGFSSSVLEKEVGFSGFPEYTDTPIENVTLENDGGTVNLNAGTKIEYRCKETGIIYTKDGTSELYTFENGQLKMTGLGAAGTDIVVQQVYSDDGKTITNKLVDRTQVKVTKTWSGLSAGQWPTNAVVNVKLRREGSEDPVVDLNGNTVTSITLSAGAQEGVFSNLPRYDDNGREITYYVEEKETTVIADGKEYSYYDTSYNKTTVSDNGVNIRQTNAILKNTLPGTGNIEINVNKRWLDDGDMVHREDVTVGIFSISDIKSGDAFDIDGKLLGSKAVATTTMNDNDAWTAKLTFEPNRKINYYAFNDGFNYNNATQTKANKKPVYKDGKHVVDGDNNPLYWVDGSVVETETATDYPVYIQKTVTEYTTTDGTVQATNYDGTLLYWADEAKTITTTKENDNPVWIQVKSDPTTKYVYLNAEGKETTQITNIPVYIQKVTTTDGADRYIALEMKVGNAEVTYKKNANSNNGKPYAWLTESATQVMDSDFDKGEETSKQIGDVEATNHLYNVYLGYTNANGMKGYVIYNQRKGVQKITLTKEWKNGSLLEDEQPKAAYYKLYQWLDDEKTDVTASLGGGTQQLASYGNISQADSERIGIVVEVQNGNASGTDTNQRNAAIFENLPKYDHLGKLLHYTVEEVAVKDPNPNTTTTGEGDSSVTITTYPIRLVQNGTVKVSVKQGGEFKYDLGSTDSNVSYFDSYTTSMIESQLVVGGKNTNDEFQYESVNTRSQNFDITLRKIWQDDGTNQTQVAVRRPDIYFRIYRIAITKNDANAPKTESDLLKVGVDTGVWDVTTLISKSQQVGGDYIWNTKKNNWYWTCETGGTFERYDAYGNEYLYYAIENSQNFNNYEVKYYNGNALPSESSDVKDTTQVFDPNDNNSYTGKLLIVHKEGAGLQSNGSIVNVKKDTFSATAEKKWLNIPNNMDKTKLPDIYMELRRRLVLDEGSQNYGPWETVYVKKNQGGAATSVFNNVERYDEFGRKYEYAVQEKYYESYGDIALGTKLLLDADCKFILAASGTTLDTAIASTNSTVTLGEGYYIKVDGAYKVPTVTDTINSETKYYTKKVTYTQANDGAYVKYAENEFVLYEGLTTDEKACVDAGQRYTRAEAGYHELGTGTEILALNYVPGYEQGQQQGDNKFTWANKYDPNAQVRQRVEIRVDKTWSVPDYATEIPNQTFELWRKIDGVTGTEEKVSTDTVQKQSVSKANETDTSITVNTTVTFTTSGINGTGTNYLPYFAPNGKQYTYYIKEVVPYGYEASLGDSKKQGDGTVTLDTTAIVLDYYSTKTENDKTIVVFSNYAKTETSGGTGNVPQYTNTYNGLPIVTNKAVKVWDDQSNAFGMRPTDIDLQLIQSGAGLGEGRTVAEWIQNNTAKQNGTWSTDTSKTKPTADTWEFTFTNDQIKDDDFLKTQTEITGTNTNFPKYGPNGEAYTYTVTESKSGSDTTNKFGSYDQKIVTTKDSSGNTTNTITNTLPTTSISVKKVWKGTDGQLLDESSLAGKTQEQQEALIAEFNRQHSWIYDGTNTHTDEEFMTLCDLGAVPTKITFKLQYRDSDTADWTDVPDATAYSEKKYTKVYNLAKVDTSGNLIIDGNGKLSWDKTVIENMRSDGDTFEDLPKYILGNNTNGTLRQYRVLETPEYTKVTKTENTPTTDTTDTPTYTYTVSHPELTSLNAGQFQQEGTATTAKGDGTNETSIATNTLTLKKITLDKYWDDGTNYMNTRPSSVVIDVSNDNGEETYTLNELSSQINTNEDWYKEVWIPNIHTNVSETISDTVNSSMKDLYTATVTIDSTDNTVKVTNTLKDTIKKRTSITVSKIWNDGTGKDYSAFYSAIRPDQLEITYKLQYSYRKVGTTDTWWDGTTDDGWKDADAGCGIGVGDNAGVGNTLTTKYNQTNQKSQDVTWTNLFQYFKDDNTAQALPIRYRVVETAVNGYTTSYSTNNGNEIVASTATAVENTLNTTGAITVTNTVVNTTTATLKKQWDDLEASTIAIETALSGTQTGKIGTSTTAEALDSLDDIKALQDKGILPYAIRFQLQFTTADNPNVSDWEDASNKVYEADTPEELLAVLKGTAVYTDLPKTGTNGKQIKYRFVESAIKFTSTGSYVNVVSAATTTNPNELSDDTTLYTVDTERTSSTDATSTNVTDTTTITNKIPTGTIEVSKSVIDEGNRDNMRGDIKVTLQRKVGENYTDYATGTLTYDDTTGTWTSISFSVPIYDTSTFTDKKTGPPNEWKVVENGVVKSDGSIDINGYSPTVVYSSTDNVKLTSTNKTGIMAIENTRVPARFTVSAQKKWADDNNSMLSRPTNSEVNFTLQYSTDKGKTWHDVIESASGDTAPGTGTDTSKPYFQTYDDRDKHSGYYYSYDGTIWTESGNGVDAYTTSNATQVVNGLTGTDEKKATWNNVPVYTVKAADNDGIIYYRVVENRGTDGGNSSVVTGYKVVTADDINISGATLQTVEGQIGVFTAAKDATADVTITNNVDTVSLELKKTWKDDLTNDYTKAMRPDKVKYKIEYTLKGSSEWKALPKGITTSVTLDDNGCFTLDSSKTSKTDKVTIAGLPLKNNSDMQYLYRISEVAIIYSGTPDVEVGANLVKSSDTVTWTMANGSDSNFAETTDNSGNTVGPYTITNGQTVWDATNKKWVTNIENKLETVSLVATKNWVDDDNRDNKQVDITFNVAMKVNGTENTNFTVESQNLLLTAKDTNNNRVTTVTWTNLPKYSKTATSHSDTTQYQYFVSESDVQNGTGLTEYDVKNCSTPTFDSTTEKWSTTITNIHDIDTFVIKGEKYWDDGIADNEVWVSKEKVRNNQRPTNITLTLQYLNTSNEWTDVKNATLVNDVELPAEARGSDATNKYPIYFKYSGTASEDTVRNSSGYYIWENGAYVPDNSGIYTTSSIDQNATATSGNTWTGYKWENLPVYHNNGTSNGQVIIYRVYEATTNWSTCYFAQPSATITGLDNSGNVVTEKTGTVTNKLIKLKLVKTDGNSKLKDVTFKLVNKANSNETYEVKTNESGEIIFTGLAQGTYEITELSTATGHQLLSAPFEVTIPQTLSKELADQTEGIDLTNAVLDNTQSEYSFYQLTYTVTNTANFTVPTTGGEGNMPWYPVVIVILGLGISLAGYLKRRAVSK